MIAVDTGFLYALVDRNDAWHERAKALAPTSSDGWITTWPVLTETTHLMMRWLGPEFACALMDDVAGGGILVWEPSEPLKETPGRSQVSLTPLGGLTRSGRFGGAHVGRIPALMRRYAKLPMDLADASLVLLAEHLGHGHILSTDERDFATYRWKNRQPFKNLLAA